jgi:hypothetical protein
LTLEYKFEDNGFFNVSYWGTDNIIFSQSEAPGVPGDFNSDGAVNAGDHVAWKKFDGTDFELPNDDDLGTPIGPDHYDLWRTNFGNPTGGFGAAAVPEPASLLLIVAALAFLFAVRWR